MAASASLLVDDDPNSCASLSDIISDLGYEVGMAYAASRPQETTIKPSH
jgi:hypothetical protein